VTDAGGVLASSVTLLGPDFQLATFPVGSTPPAWARALITNPKAWETAPQEDAPPAAEDTPPADAPDASEKPEEDLVGELPEPPKRGAGSGKEAWAAYAESKGVAVTDGMSRDDIIEAVEAAESE
jgi:hypothetical protein